VPSFLDESAPVLYRPIERLLPSGWIDMPATEGLGRTIAALLYVVLISIVWVGYLGAARALLSEDASPGPRTPSRLKHILLGGLVFGLLATAWPGLFSTDVYLYASQGKMQTVYGFNPVVQPPRLMGDDPLLELTPWRDILAAYGPIWLMFARAISALAEALGGERVIYVLGFRALNLVLMAVGTWLVWAIGGLLDWSAGRRAAAAALFAWCPLMIIELVANAHNDALLVVCVLAAIWLHLRGAWPLAVIALVMGGLVKLTGFFLLPAYGVLLMRTSRNQAEAARRIVAGLGASAAVILIAYLPYADPAMGRALLSNPMAGFATNSLGTLVRAAIIDIALLLRGTLTPNDLTWRQALEAIRWPVWYGPLLLWGFLLLFFSLQVRDVPGLLRAWGLALFTYLVIAAVWFWPWYIGWLVPILALLPPSPLRRAGLLLAFGGTLTYTFYPLGPFLLAEAPPRFLESYITPTIIFLPTLLYLLYRAWVYVRSRSIRSPESAVSTQQSPI
jgi:hypothetical protein